MYVDLTNTSGSVRTGAVATATHDDLPLAGVRSHGVDTVKPWGAGLGQAATLIYV